MNLRKFHTALIALLCSITFPAAAHHSDGRPEAVGDWILVKGTVASFRWSTPHVTLLVDVVDASGVTNKHTIVLPSPQEIKRATGWTLSTFRPGEPVEMKVYPSTGIRQAECPVRCMIYLNEDLVTPQWDSQRNRWEFPR